MNRWNVALSIIITTNEMFNPDDIEIFADKKISEGLGFLHMVKKWVQETSSVVSNSKGKRRREDDNGINGIIEWIVDGKWIGNRSD
ncbi:hypothetical protein RhiirA1_469808 [Rhizophagus irregularis]|uniref:Uncharacterized protein n=1 Tax=Rhizophagus irregularis TaxID=588596 RepID=A0A2I1F3Z9_9GLOM|nr:hypothetical protein RhiirA1_469808 [Rhizophagus irregularis]PKY29101.1 hypothetical protein RhiirB3_445593 [Rhizophagus irregularis]